MSKIYNHYKDHHLIKPYVPDRFAKGRQIDRTWFFNIFNTLAPKELKSIIDNAHKKRQSLQEEHNKGEVINMDPAWREKLMKVAFKSSKISLCLTLFRATRQDHLPLEAEEQAHQV